MQETFSDFYKFIVWICIEPLLDSVVNRSLQEWAGKSESLPQKPYSFSACWLDNSLATLEQKNRIEFIDFDHYKYLASCVLNKRWNDMKLVNFFYNSTISFFIELPTISHHLLLVYLSCRISLSSAKMELF